MRFPDGFFLPIPAWGSIETTTIRKTHITLPQRIVYNIVFRLNVWRKWMTPTLYSNVTRSWTVPRPVQNIWTPPGPLLKSKRCWLTIKHHLNLNVSRDEVTCIEHIHKSIGDHVRQLIYFLSFYQQVTIKDKYSWFAFFIIYERSNGQVNLISTNIMGDGGFRSSLFLRFRPR